ncbi:glutamate synthase-related protein [Amycolatopsis balhimycina]|uniref:glutamate synthase-related protein n=1 Tax=Amycolatopsis balhimycina TaxID=208443 RepID=UPI0003629EBB|nr:glutamate synthase-related protein [Amycolatopsis balhimycina]
MSLKLSQGAKPGIGGVLPGGKVNAEIARVRDVPQGKSVISPPYHRVFSIPFATSSPSMLGGWRSTPPL